MTLNSQTRLSSDVIAVPKYIEIPGKLKKLPIIAGSFKNDQWDLATNSALYLQGSESEDFGKNTVIYGHDINSIFAPLSTVQLGDFIRIETSKNLAVNFKVIKIEKVLPNDVSILSQDYNNQLTLFTCTGLFDSMRLVIISKKIG